MNIMLYVIITLNIKSIMKKYIIFIQNKLNISLNLYDSTIYNVKYIFIYSKCLDCLEYSESGF